MLPEIVCLGKATDLIYFGEAIEPARGPSDRLTGRGELDLMDEAYKQAACLKEGELYVLRVTKNCPSTKATKLQNGAGKESERSCHTSLVS